MNTISRGVVQFRCGIRRDVINILVFLDGLFHQLVGHSHLLGLGLVGLAVEIARLPPDSTHENHRYARLGSLDSLYEVEQIGFYAFVVTIGESVEYEGLHVGLGKG